MTVPWEVLVVSSDVEKRRELAAILRRENIDAIRAGTVRECRAILAKDGVGLIFCDKQLLDGTYRDLIAASRAMKSRARVVVTSHEAEWDEYLEAMRLGAFDVIASPCRPTDVEWMVIQARRDERIRVRQVLASHPMLAADSVAQA
jgi:two-component system, NtrC family, response regulator PilR